MGYPATGILRNTVISVNLSFEELKKVDEYCKIHGISRSSAFRDALNLVLWMQKAGTVNENDQVEAYFDAMEVEKAKRAMEAATVSE